MNDFFDRHGKKFIAVVMALLMIAFILPSVGGRGGGNGGNVGTIGGSRINAADVQAAGNVLRSLDRIVVPNQQTGQPTPLPRTMFGPQLGGQLEQNPLQWYLLLEEAARAGVVADESQIDRRFGPQMKLVTDDGRQIDLDQVNPTVRDALREDFRRAWSVVLYYSRAQQKLKISRPLVDDELAGETQQIKARVVAFDAADYEKQVTAPTDADLKRQFDAYADVAPGAVDEGNPFGFGYRVPDRAAVQWLAVPDAEVARVVEATQKPERWDEDARYYYTLHAKEFQTPTTRPADVATTRPYEAAAADVAKKVRAPLIEQLKRKAAALIVQRMNADWEAAAKAPSTRPAATQAATTAYGVPFGSFEYLQKLADDVQKQTGVRPTAVAPAGLLGRDELRKQPGFGAADLADAQGNAALGGPAYLFSSLKALRPTPTASTSATATPPASTATATLELGRPTVPLAGADGLYVARAVAAEPAHAPGALADVREAVERDVRRSKAFDLAAAAAQAALDKAKAAGGFVRAGLTFQTSDWFGLSDPTVPGLTADYADRLPGPAFEVLRGLTAAADLPRTTLAKLRREGKAVAIEVFDVKSTLTTSSEPTFRAQAEQRVAEESMASRDPNVDPTANPAAAAIEQWFGVDAVGRRVGYVPDTSQTPKPTTPAPVGPAAPFIPG